MNDAAPAPIDLEPAAKAWPALLMSLVFHIVLLTGIGLIWTRKPGGSGETEDRRVGIALVHRMPDRDFYREAEPPVSETETPSDQQSSVAAAAAAPPADLSPPIDLDGILKSMQSTPMPHSATGLAGETQLDGDAFGDGRGRSTAGDAGQATTMVFGVSGSGSRFVYVFDRSDSMNGFGGKPLRAAKNELIRSLQTLTDKQRFQLIFYNEKPTPFRIAGMPIQMMAGDGPNLTLAQQYIRSVTAFGGTEHETAIKMALRLSPDVIFFLTDARIPRLSESELRQIQSRAQQAGTTIHAIEFGGDAVAPSDSFLRDLAAMNGGQYQYVDIRRLQTATPP
ncbi:hypothetical protein K227x_00250 [Rubripirellula lacrimiformis]|uniref:VWFA domain-containing protein n=1 Tax=Rubripirellula lacrimiformis TaxID=1930273 RepID=A0A517N3T9_9BACT|nr:hypothetical protein [Rubripirellula lacrimiformis]QDT01658.1 hypothetical protein K227x_00250 [Rubripirellula lacrimiformis]